MTNCSSGPTDSNWDGTVRREAEPVKETRFIQDLHTRVVQWWWAGLENCYHL